MKTITLFILGFIDGIKLAFSSNKNMWKMFNYR